MPIKKRHNSVVALDVGANKIACLVGSRTSGGDCKILGVGYGKSEGITAGSISNIRAAEKSIKSVIESAEESSKQRISDVFLGVSSNLLISHTTKCEMHMLGREVTSKDISKLILSKTDSYTQHNISVIHTFLYDYSLDGNKNIISPVGLYADLMSCKMNIISTNTNNILNFSNCLAGCSVNIKGYVSSSYANGSTSLTHDELSLGVNLIDFGADTTSIAVFRNMNMVYTDGIPMGMSNVTRDIAIILGISEDNAERIKNLYGSCMQNENDRGKIIELEDENEEIINIDISILTSIIQARVEEILEMVVNKVVESGVPLASRNVISGGGAKLGNISRFIEKQTQINSRIGFAKEAKDINDDLKLEMTNVYGILMHGLSLDRSESYLHNSNRRGILTRFLQRYGPKWL